MADSTNPDRQTAIDLVQNFMALLVDPARAHEVRPLITDEYIQHNPNIPSGADAIIEFTQSIDATAARDGMRPSQDEAPMFVCEGDKVVMILPRDVPDPTDPSKTYRSYWFDMWRIKNGKLAEHWDAAPKEKLA